MRGRRYGVWRDCRGARHEEGTCTPARAAFTHALALRSRRPRVIHGVLRASGVCNCCVFFIKPRQRTNRWPKRRLMTRTGCFVQMREASIIPMALASPQTRSEQANTKAKPVLPV
ncbi:hypothetical protein RSIPO_04351 [Ralstonia solanacearum IPO1609]|uniref:Uncharacterized protein n=1 Tax=Ralstonia solanacearum IPO1609 TaxID=564066 RepID=A0A7U7JFA8_RALSL|nr:hypothetical protein RSIPO_04351 [Ralstonia solanacearum IPO1609]